MTDKELQELLDYMEDFSKKVRKDPELGKQFLIEAGILNQDGRFTESYSHLGALKASQCANY